MLLGSWADTVGGSAIKHFQVSACSHDLCCVLHAISRTSNVRMSTFDWQVRDILDPKSHKESKSLPSSRAAPAPYVLSVRAQVQNTQALTDASHVAISVKPARFTVCLMMLATETPCYVFWLKATVA
jgi:hypothetical protein